ncbi:MAG: hypothetical protein OEY52_08000 [Gammaproteobacteria bacterium]|nr:hypothetical protein [Gammaproteobacteria bacterium]
MKTWFRIPFIAILLLPQIANSETVLKITKLVNLTGYSIGLLDIGTTVKHGESFQPTVYADESLPPMLNEIDKLDVTQLASKSYGMAIKLKQANTQTVIHGYLVVYSGLTNMDTSSSSKIRIHKSHLKLAQQGQVTVQTGTFPHKNQTRVRWILWLSNKSLDVDCGCM